MALHVGAARATAVVGSSITLAVLVLCLAALYGDEVWQSAGTLNAIFERASQHATVVKNGVVEGNMLTIRAGRYDNGTAAVPTTGRRRSNNDNDDLKRTTTTPLNTAAAHAVAGKPKEGAQVFTPVGSVDKPSVKGKYKFVLSGGEVAVGSQTNERGGGSGGGEKRQDMANEAAAADKEGKGEAEEGTTILTKEEEKEEETITLSPDDQVLMTLRDNHEDPGPMPTQDTFDGDIVEAQRKWLAHKTMVLQGEAKDVLEAATAGQDHKFIVQTFADSGVLTGVVNWSRHLKAAKVPHAVGALDQLTYDTLRKDGTPTFLLRDFIDLRTYIENSATNTAELKYDTHHKSRTWNLLVTQRVGWGRALVHAGYDVLLSDMDVIWLRDPRNFLYCNSDAARKEGCNQLMNADAMISSDRMSPVEDDQKTAQYAKHGTLNSGIVFLRSTRAGKFIANEWYRHVLERDGNYATLTTDQQIFNNMAQGYASDILFADDIPGVKDPDSLSPQGKIKLLRTNPSRAIKMQMQGPPSSHQGEWPPITAPLAILPLRYFNNGHVYFNQRTFEQTDGGSPYCAHATYTGAGTDGTTHASKSTRFKEAGLWMVEDDYEGSGNEKYLTWDPQVPKSLIECEGHKHCQRGHACMRDDDQCPMNCHARAMKYQLSHLWGAIGVAKALQRTLVFPRLVCHCDRAWDGHGETIQQCCKYTGAEMDDYMPMMQCPWDLVVPRNKLLTSYLKWREAGFLEGRFAPKDASDTAIVRVRARDANADGDEGASLPAGATADEIRSALANNKARVLKLHDANYAFCGFGNAEEDALFDKTMQGKPLEQRRASKWFKNMDGTPALEPDTGVISPSPPWCSELNLPKGNCSQNFHEDLWPNLKKLWNNHKKNELCCFDPTLPLRVNGHMEQCQSEASAGIVASAF